MTWLITTVCLAGTVLNVKKRRECFYLWIVGNIAWLAYDVWCSLYSRAVLDLAFAIWGAIEWGREQ